MQSRYSNDYLMQALEFTRDDLAANRSGVMTETQKERFRARMRRGQKQGIVIMMLVLLVTMGVVAFLVFGNAEEGSGLRQAIEQSPEIIAIGLGGSLLLYLAIVVFAFLRIRRMSSGNLRVHSIEGQVKLKSSELPGYTAAGAIASAAGAQTRICEIKIGRTSMYTDEESFEAFEDGGAYRIYYVGNKRAPVIIAAELA
jgi:hypothetical protein